VEKSHSQDIGFVPSLVQEDGWMNNLRPGGAIRWKV
jgi:hypothetical protein